MYKLTIVCAMLMSACISCQQPTVTQETSPASSPPDVIDDHNNASSDQNSNRRDYYFPTPGEIFTALSKIDDVEWLRNASLVDKPEYTGDAHNSFWLGVCVADAFVALKAEERDVFSNMNQSVYHFSEKLGIDGELEGAKKQLSDNVSGGDLQALTSGLDLLYRDFVQSLSEYRNGEIIYTYSNIGGWAEGVRIIGSDVLEDFNTESAELLFDSRLVSELVQLAHRNTQMPDLDKDKVLKEQLKKALQIIKDNEGNINPQAVTDLVMAANNILNTLR